MPLTVEIDAEQFAFVPPLLPAQVQFHGPLPVTVDAVPVVQRLVVGVLIKVPELLLPHTPLILSAAKFAVIIWVAVTLVRVSGLLVLVTNPPVPVQLTK